MHEHEHADEHEAEACEQCSMCRSGHCDCNDERALPPPDGPIVTLTEKVYVPVKDNPNVRSFAVTQLHSRSKLLSL